MALPYKDYLLFTQDSYRKVNMSEKNTRDSLKCCVPFCRCEITSQLYRFPKDVDRCQKWLKIIKREDLIQKLIETNGQSEDIKSLRICEEHFDKSWFLMCNVTLPGRKTVKVLKDAAYPSLMLPEDPDLLESLFYKKQEMKKNTNTRKERSVHVQTPATLYYKTNYHTRHLRQFLEQSRQKLNTDLFELVKEQTGTENSCVGQRNSYDYQKFCHTLQKISPAAYNLVEKRLDIKLSDETLLKRFQLHLDINGKRQKIDTIHVDNPMTEDTTIVHKSELNSNEFLKEFQKWQTDPRRENYMEVSTLTHNPQAKFKIKCFVTSCNNYRRQGGKQLFKFPGSLEMCKLWLKMMKNEYQLTKLTQDIASNIFNESLPFITRQYVCEIHFNDICFDPTVSCYNPSKKLLDWAYPTLNIVEKDTRSTQKGDGIQSIIDITTGKNIMKKPYSIFMEHSRQKLDKNLFELVIEQISGGDKFNYSMGFKKLCLDLYKISPAAYVLLDKRFELNLPDIKSIEGFEEEVNFQDYNYCNDDARPLKFAKILPKQTWAKPGKITIRRENSIKEIGANYTKPLTKTKIKVTNTKKLRTIVPHIAISAVSPPQLTKLKPNVLTLSGNESSKRSKQHTENLSLLPTIAKPNHCEEMDFNLNTDLAVAVKEEDDLTDNQKR